MTLFVIFLYITKPVACFADDSDEVADKEEKTKVPTEEELLQFNEQAFMLSQKDVIAKLKKKYCKKYNNQYIAYYNNVYLVKKCKLKKISHTLSFKLSQRAKKITSVESEVIAALDRGTDIDTFDKIKFRSCSALNGRYITFKDVDVYYVKNCKKNKLENWQVYLEHATIKGKRYKPILSLTSEEFFEIKYGNDILESDIKIKQQAASNSSASAHNIDDADIDIIPLKEACKGLNGKYVSFYSRLYKIENCRKKFISTEEFLKMNKSRRVKITELNSEQWISIPLKKTTAKTQKKPAKKNKLNQLYRAH